MAKGESHARVLAVGPERAAAAAISVIPAIAHVATLEIGHGGFASSSTPGKASEAKASRKLRPAMGRSPASPTDSLAEEQIGDDIAVLLPWEPYL